MARGTTEIPCLALSNDGNAAWPASIAGTASVAGTCVAGYSGTVSRACMITGAWDMIQGSCTRTRTTPPSPFTATVLLP
jgi:hypothetical protein